MECLPERQVLLIAGAGFDPRSTAVAKRLAAATASLRALFLQENRLNPAQALLERASANTVALLGAVKAPDVIPVDIFGPDGAVIGGRNAITIMSRQDFTGVTDAVIDIQRAIGRHELPDHPLLRRAGRTGPWADEHPYLRRP